MKFVIPILPEVTLENARIYFKHHNQENADNSFRWMTIGLGVAVLGFALPVNYFIKIILGAIGLAVAFIFGFYFTMILRHKKRYLAETAKEYNEPGEMTIELTEDQFIYEDIWRQSKTSWRLIESYFIEEEVLFVNYKDTTGCMISRKVVSERDLDDMVKFLDRKVARKKKKLTL